MERSALDTECENHGCAKVFLDPKLHFFDDCFPANIRMGDVDFTVERRGHILEGEWKRGVILDAFEDQYKAQIRRARAFTLNSPRQTFTFVAGCPVKMAISRFIVMTGGEWQFGGWIEADAERFKSFLRHWYSVADRSAA